MKENAFLIWIGTFGAMALSACASDLDEFKVKREEVFEFEQNPKVTRQGDRVGISFAVKGNCDVTVAIESQEGRIVRHLASGVLGKNAPEPFQKNALAQTIFWDGKNDEGRYLDEKETLSVRVSLGLKPRFERNLFWDPKKRIANECPLLQAAPEGVYVYEGKGVDHIRLFDHEGNYARTVYPPAADVVDKMKGIARGIFPQDGKDLPIKQGFVQATFLTSGTSSNDNSMKFGDGYAAMAMAVNKEQMALAYDFVNRLATDGSTGGLPLRGQQVANRITTSGYGGFGNGEQIIGPSSLAFSPDSKWLYMTGFMWREAYSGYGDCFHGVLKVPFAEDTPRQVFAGEMKRDDGYGSDAKHFKVPTSVACDAQGRVYVSDHLNDRIQVFGPDGNLLKSIPSPKPAKVLVSPKNGEVWVFSWPVIGISNKILKDTGFDWSKIPATLTRYGSFDNPAQRSSSPVPLTVPVEGQVKIGSMQEVAVDWWVEPPVLWEVRRKGDISKIDVAWTGVGNLVKREGDGWSGDGVRLLAEKDGKWTVKRDFSQDAKPTVARLKPPAFSRQRLYINPKNEKLYVGEDNGFSKSFYQMVEIDPETGKVQLLELPFDAEDICFDVNGLIYMRTDSLVVRYDTQNWREVPWDYGEEHQQVGFTSMGGSRRANVISGLPLPGHRPVCWNMGGMSISHKGNLAVSCNSFEQKVDRRGQNDSSWDRVRSGGVQDLRPYTPSIYPGRTRWQEIHIWDKHGKLIMEDAVQGITSLHGLEIDRDDNLFMMATANRHLDGKPYFNEMSGTVMKFKPKKAKVTSTGRAAVPLTKEQYPNRPADVTNTFGGSAWVEGAEWFFGGVGYGGFNTARAGGGCDCWNSKFVLDFFSRSFAPETDHCSVAVLDTNGNLIVRMGRYANVDSAGPQSRVPLGGDEIGLFHPVYMGTHTDRRAFISDPGNGRIVGVKLEYHANERVPLKGIADAGK